MEWTVAHDVLLCREMLAINPLKAKRKTIETPNEQKASGISPEMSELDVLMEELTGLEDMSEEEKVQNESEEKNRKTEQDRVKALDMRKKAMEKLSETTSSQSSRKKISQRRRHSTSDTIEYLKERNEAEFALQREQLELKKKEQEEKSKKDEEAAKRQGDLMRMMVQQNQIMLQVISKLLHK